MKKFLLLLLLTILPIQYAWSMAATYCQHEESKVSKVSHFGHHGHQHQAQAGDQSDHDEQGQQSKTHGDCEVCHHAVQASVLDDSSVITPAAAGALFAPSSPHYLSYIAEGPPRPNWQFVA